jgi:hypothetical protein
VWYVLLVPLVDKILSSETPQPLDALSLAVRIALQSSLLPHILLEDVPVDTTYEERASLMDNQEGRIPHDEKVFQVDDDWVSCPSALLISG